jgi:hypothetical protein
VLILMLSHRGMGMATKTEKRMTITTALLAAALHIIAAINGAWWIWI